MCAAPVNEEHLAKALVAVLGETSWVAVLLAKAVLARLSGASLDEAAELVREQGGGSRKLVKELLTRAETDGLTSILEPRKKTGSAENPITKLFPAVITEQRFGELLQSLVAEASRLGRVLTIEDHRKEHSFIDFVIREREMRLPVNVKNAGTLFRKSAALVGIDPADCIPIPAYKAFGALEAGESNLVYVVCVDMELVGVIRELVPSIFNQNEKIVWELLERYVGRHVRRAEDAFVLSMVNKYWSRLSTRVAQKPFRLISAQKAIKILQSLPKRTPGLGLAAWGTGASAEVNVHVSISRETLDWNSLAPKIAKDGLGTVLSDVNRKSTAVIADPAI
jgi:hypothetical protein